MSGACPSPNPNLTRAVWTTHTCSFTPPAHHAPPPPALPNPPFPLQAETTLIKTQGQDAKFRLLTKVQAISNIGGAAQKLLDEHKDKDTFSEVAQALQDIGLKDVEDVYNHFESYVRGPKGEYFNDKAGGGEARNRIQRLPKVLEAFMKNAEQVLVPEDYEGDVDLAKEDRGKRPPLPCTAHDLALRHGDHWEWKRDPDGNSVLKNGKPQRKQDTGFGKKISEQSLREAAQVVHGPANRESGKRKSTDTCAPSGSMAHERWRAWTCPR